MTAVLLQVVERPDTLSWGIFVPTVIFIVAFAVTMMLYRHFSKDQSA